MPVGNSRFIVIEGLDGAGTTTQAHMLDDYFRGVDEDTHLTFEPTGGPIGAFTRELIAGDSGSGSEGSPTQRVLGLLFAADRLVHSSAIERHIARGRRVICDRYVYSSLAYQTLDPTVSPDWVADVNAGCAIPDVTVFLDVPVETCLERISLRNEGRTIFEHADSLQNILDNYRRLGAFYQAHYGPMITIDGTGTPDEVLSAIVSAVS